MADQNDLPVYNSDEGRQLYQNMAELLKNIKNSETIALLSAIRLLTIIPQEIYEVTICPNVDLPMHINHSNELAKTLVLARLRANV